MSDRIHGLHHITLCTSTAQADTHLFMKVLGMSLVKQTLLYDGTEPIYHLYFANETGTPGTITTVFPWRRTGRKARPGTGQISLTSYAVPTGSLDWWKERLLRFKVPVHKVYERFGQKILQFGHPECALTFELVEDATDQRPPFKSAHVPANYAIRGFHSWTVALRDAEDMHFFMNEGWNYQLLGRDGAFSRYQTDNGTAAHIVDLHHQPDVPQGNWSYGEGMVHHGAFAVNSLDVQTQVKLEVEGLGFTDCSDRKHRGYFESVYIRTPGGALFEATHSIGFDADEPADKIGHELQVSPQFRQQREELVKRLNDPYEVY